MIGNKLMVTDKAIRLASAGLFVFFALQDIKID